MIRKRLVLADDYRLVRKCMRALSIRYGLIGSENR
jgi:hypothetical protein